VKNALNVLITLTLSEKITSKDGRVDGRLTHASKKLFKSSKSLKNNL